MGSRILGVGAALAAALSATSVAWAVGDPDLAVGLISERCVACHQVPGFTARNGQTNINAPSFQKIADEPGVYTQERLRTILQQPHWPMGQFVLSQSDIDNILAFFDRLAHERK